MLISSATSPGKTTLSEGLGHVLGNLGKSRGDGRDGAAGNVVAWRSRSKTSGSRLNGRDDRPRSPVSCARAVSAAWRFNCRTPYGLRWWKIS